MRRARNISANGEGGVVILIVAVVLLFVVGAMAALSIDVVTFYTARSEAQLVADAAALGAARVFANSGLTSTPAGTANAKPLAISIANQIAQGSNVGGRPLIPANGEVTVTFPNETDASFNTNPHVTVRASRTDLPTFFARIWGSRELAVSASATAEAYNPSGATVPPLTGPVIPVAPSCVKPWVLPNITPTDGTSQIIDPATGKIVDTSLVGANIIATKLQPACAPGNGAGGCGNSGWFTPPPAPSTWKFYPGDPSSFPAPTGSLPSCASSFNAYQQSVAGCVETPIVCGTQVNLDFGVLTTYHRHTAEAVNCLTNASANEGDSVDQASGVPPTAPYQFLTGADNPLVQAGSIPQGTDVIVSDSIVTLPIYDSGAAPPSANPTVIGFVQVFLNVDGNAAPTTGPSRGQILTQVINIAGCGTGATGPPYILGNGASTVPVRLITPP